ncbi:MAG: GIY-YIG nuclease family protein [Candidatus Eremiobacteraeota bacterium]|nr:GIY-YIG nuclease family protein [Candidatus Eremiobacteraeota bacterium]
MKTYFVYMVRRADGSFYVGITNNAEFRVAQHNYGSDPKCYTFTRRPVVPVHVAEFAEVWDAIRWEKQLKGWSRAKKLTLVADDWEAIHALARCTGERLAVKARPSTSALRASAQDDTEVLRLRSG